MIHLVIREPIEYQKTLCQALSDAYEGNFVAWFANRDRAHADSNHSYVSRFLPDVGYWQFFRELKADKRPIVILGGWSSTFAWFTILITTLLRVPLFIWADHPFPRQSRDRLRRAYLKFLTHRVTGVLACGKPTADHLAHLGFEPSTITNFPYWVELQKEWSLPPRCQRPNREDPVRLIAVGRHVQVKAFDIAIQAVAIANQSAGRQVASLELVGDGPQRKSLESLAESCDSKDAIVFSGWLNNREVLTRISASDALIIPSTFEPYGVVLLEALANGRQVLASDGVVAALDRDDGSGAILFHRANDAQQLADQIEQLSRDTARLRQMSQAARSIAERWPPERAAGILNRAFVRVRPLPLDSSTLTPSGEMRIEVRE